MTTKHCPTCDKTKPTTDFNANTKRRDGLQTQCRGCQSDHHRAWYRANPGRRAAIREATAALRAKAQEVVWAHLSTHPCVACGEADPLVLEFDHRQDKTFNISHMITGCYKINSLKEEIAKCDVRCANCHRRKTAHDFGFWKALRYTA